MTPGIAREVSFATERAQQIRARVEGMSVTGWHHHGDREVLGFVLRGRARFEFGPAGRRRRTSSPAASSTSRSASSTGT